MGLLDEISIIGKVSMEMAKDKVEETAIKVVEKSVETCVKAVGGTLYLTGKTIKPDLKNVHENGTPLREFTKNYNASSNFIESATKAAVKHPLTAAAFAIHPTIGITATIIQEGMYSRKDVQQQIEVHKAHKEGFEAGYRKGNTDAVKKFAALLEQSDNFRIGAFAVGYHVAKLGGNSNDKLGVIMDALGEPDSKLLTNNIRQENSKILSDNPTFVEICNNYLDSLSIEQLNSIDSFLVDIINAGDSSAQELNFYNNDWKEYLTRRSK